MRPIPLLSVAKQLTEAAEKKRDHVIELTSKLVTFNTTSPNPGQEPADDQECQGYLAEQLKPLGFEVNLWEPSMDSLSHYYSKAREQAAHSF